MTQDVETKEETVTRPNDYLTVSVRMPGESEFQDKDLFMSAGLVRALVAITHAGGEVTDVYANPMIQDLMLVEILSPRAARGKKAEHYEAKDFDLNSEDGDAIIDWATQHVLYFFTRAVSKLTTAMGSETGGIKTLMASISGLADLAEKKPSAGDLDAKSEMSSTSSGPTPTQT